MKATGFKLGNKDPKKRGLDITIRNKRRATYPSMTRVFAPGKWSVKKV